MTDYILATSFLHGEERSKKHEKSNYESMMPSIKKPQTKPPKKQTKVNKSYTRKA